MQLKDTFVDEQVAAPEGHLIQFFETNEYPEIHETIL